MGIIKDIFLKHGAAYIEAFGSAMPSRHKKVINAIINCKTDMFGICVYQCENCKARHLVPLACGDRHCPNCQYHKAEKWKLKQQMKQVPGHHFMITFTVPEQIRSFIRSHQKATYSALFAASSQSLKKLAADPRHLGGDLPGFYGILHTWGRQMQYHPHIHYVVSGCSLRKKDRVCFTSRNNFYVPVKALAQIYKAKFIDLMKKEGLYEQIPAAAWEPAWNVNCQAGNQTSKAPDDVSGADGANNYLANYVFKVAVSDSRVSTDSQHVFLSYKKQKSNRVRKIKLDPMEFIRRFLQHVLPKGFMKIRYYGFMHPSCAVTLDTLKAIIAKAIGLKSVPEIRKQEVPPEPVCKCCNGVLLFKYFMPPAPLSLQGLSPG
jgi:hypothetical protein